LDFIGIFKIFQTPEDSGILNLGDCLIAPTTDPARKPLFVFGGGFVLEMCDYKEKQKQNVLWRKV